MSNKNDVEEWLSMDIPDNQLSEDEYDLDEDQTDEQAQQQVHNIDSLLLQFDQDNTVGLESLENNNDMLVFDFPELNDTVLSNSNNTSFSRVLRPRATTLDDENLQNEPSNISNNLPETPVPEPEVSVDRQWRKRDNVTDELPLYEESRGHNEEMFRNCKSATDIFLKLLNPIIDHIIYQSNLYATQNNNTLKLTENELLAFIGMNFCMGYHKVPSYKHYWSTANDLNVPVVSDVMSRDRFSEILSNIHVNDNTTIPVNNKDKLYKLRPLIDSLNKTFTEAYHGTRELSVDESMIKFKGRSTLKQYNPMKPIKRGYKLWCIADQKGYILKFSIYQGKNEALEREFEHFNLGERIVLKLTKPYWKQSRLIFFDNYFTSITLLERLKTENTLACGTIRANRKGIPPNLMKDSEIVRGDFDHRFSTSGIGIFKWRDNKAVLFGSNYHGNHEITSVQRTMKDGSKLTTKCPPVVKDYNDFMGGVDLADRYRSLYNIDRKSSKWWMRIFWGLLDITFVNAYVIYGEMFGETDVLDVRRSIALGLMTSRNLPARRSVNLKRAAPKTPTNRRGKQLSNTKDVRLGNR